jgi:hypothetical protein
MIALFSVMARMASCMSVSWRRWRSLSNQARVSSTDFMKVWMRDFSSSMSRRAFSQSLLKSLPDSMVRTRLLALSRNVSAPCFAFFAASRMRSLVECVSSLPTLK